MSQYIAVIDDEPDILELVALNLKKSGFRVKEFSEVESFYRSLKTDLPDLIILDLMMPDVDGFEVCKYLKNQKNLSAVPILMLTARTEETDKVLGLELGADDYVTKTLFAKGTCSQGKGSVATGRSQAGRNAKSSRWRYTFYRSRKI